MAEPFEKLQKGVDAFLQEINEQFDLNNTQEEQTKPTLYEVLQIYDFGLPLRDVVVAMGRVKEEIAEAMLSLDMVHRIHARAVLAGLSEVTGVAWTLDNVKIALIPTFNDFHTLYQFDLELLSRQSGVSLVLINAMLRSEPIPQKVALAVLQAASQQTGQTYTLQNVDVNLEEEQYG